MKAVYLTEKTGPKGLRFGELPEPRPKEDEVSIEIHATAITPTEFAWFPTFRTRSGDPRPVPIVLSHEFSGVVKEVGARGIGLKAGDEVYGMNDWFVNGAQAQCCVAPVGALALKPSSLNEISRLFDSEIFRVFVEAVFPLAQAREAYVRANRGGLRGKVILQVAAGTNPRTGSE